MPVWQSVYEELNDPNLVLISAAQDTGGEAAAGKIFDDANVTYTAIVDTNHTISSLYNLVNVPSGIWIDEEGMIVRINEGNYAAKHEINGFKFGTDKYLPAVRDWVRNGAESEYVWTPEKVAEKIRPRTADEKLADPTFRIANYFHEQGDAEKANIYWDHAQKLHPDSWNYHRQDWSFLPPTQTNANFLKKTGALTKPYYAPLEIKSINKD